MVKPTPTQEENDRAARGEHIEKHEDDGSGPDPHAEANAKTQEAMGTGSGKSPAHQHRGATRHGG